MVCPPVPHGSVPLAAALLAFAGSLASPRATSSPPDPIHVREGFRATRVYDVPRHQGSWVSLTNADKGRLIACNQYGHLYRITLPVEPASGSSASSGSSIAVGDRVKVEELPTPVGRAQGLLFAFGSLYVMGSAGKDSGLFRLTDTTGDDRFDKVEHLLSLPVGGEHEGHAIVLAPDGKSLFICGGNMSRFPVPGFTSSRMPQVWAGDHIVPRMPDAGGHNTGALPLGGWVARVSPDASERELIASGFRNEYDIAFDPEGELFTYDSDMEWDIGAAWYRPTRICHVVSGAEFGWRYGSGKWPDYFADSLGSVLDIGPGSPTGVVFGTGARFPARYQRALFAGDWSYGILYAVHLRPDGASYSATKEVFVTAAPLPVTDLVVRPQDGALYFTIGGRGAGSALYRIDYVGSESTAPAKVSDDADQRVRELRVLRHRLEALHRPGARDAVSLAWPCLGHPDRHIRFAARIAIENQPLDQWVGRALVEKEPRRLVHAVIALARHGDPSLQTRALQKLMDVPWESASKAERLELLRAFHLVFARLGGPARREGVRAAVAEALDGRYPAADVDTNRELCRLLSHLDHAAVVAKTLRLQAEAPSQEEQMHYAYCLRVVTRGWTPEARKTYLGWFERAEGFRGGSSFRGYCRNIRRDAIACIPAAERDALGDLVTREPAPRPVQSAAARTFVRNWTIADLEPGIVEKKAGHDFTRGRRLFGEAACMRCHRFSGEGGAIGPDLSSVGGRYGIREILESILEPSKVISDQYQPTIFELADGNVVVGYVANFSSGRIKVAEDMLRPGDFTDVRVEDIKARRPSPVSMMPPGLLSTMTLEEVQDLVAYLRSGGRSDHELFRRTNR